MAGVALFTSRERYCEAVRFGRADLSTAAAPATMGLEKTGARGGDVAVCAKHFAARIEPLRGRIYIGSHRQQVRLDSPVDIWPFCRERRKPCRFGRQRL